MTIRILLLLCLLLTPPASGLTVYDPWNFSQNLRAAIQAVTDEINQLRQLHNQYLQLQKKASALPQAWLQQHLDYFKQMEAEGRRLYEALQDIGEFNAALLVDYDASGLTREQWLAAERDFYRRGNQLQQARVRQANEYRRRIALSLQVRHQLLRDNQAVAGEVAALQINNEYLEQIISHLDVLVEDIADRKTDAAEQGARDTRRRQTQAAQREEWISVYRREREKIEQAREFLRERARQPLFNWGE